MIKAVGMDDYDIWKAAILNLVMSSETNICINDLSLSTIVTVRLIQLFKLKIMIIIIIIINIEIKAVSRSKVTKFTEAPGLTKDYYSGTQYRDLTRDLKYCNLQCF